MQVSCTRSSASLSFFVRRRAAEYSGSRWASASSSNSCFVRLGCLKSNMSRLPKARNNWGMSCRLPINVCTGTEVATTASQSHPPVRSLRVRQTRDGVLYSPLSITKGRRDVAIRVSPPGGASAVRPLCRLLAAERVQDGAVVVPQVLGDGLVGDVAVVGVHRTGQGAVGLHGLHQAHVGDLPRVGTGGVGERVRGRLGHGAGHVGDAVVDDA